MELSLQELKIIVDFYEKEMMDYYEINKNDIIWNKPNEKNKIWEDLKLKFEMSKTKLEEKIQIIFDTQIK
jgi:hypothetical protein